MVKCWLVMVLIGVLRCLCCVGVVVLVCVLFGMLMVVIVSGMVNDRVWVSGNVCKCWRWVKVVEMVDMVVVWVVNMI